MQVINNFASTAKLSLPVAIFGTPKNGPINKGEKRVTSTGPDLKCFSGSLLNMDTMKAEEKRMKAAGENDGDDRGEAVKRKMTTGAP